MKLLEILNEKGLMPAASTKKVVIKLPQIITDEDGNENMELQDSELWFEILSPTSSKVIASTTVSEQMKIGLIEKIKKAVEDQNEKELEKLNQQLFETNSKVLSEVIIGWNEDILGSFDKAQLLETLSDQGTKFIHTQLTEALQDFKSFVDNAKKQYAAISKRLLNVMR